MEKIDISGVGLSEDNISELEILTEPVELYKVLKFGGVAASGGEAKSLVAGGQVSVNGAVETRKRKKVVSGDVIEVGEVKVCLRLKWH